MKKFRARGDEFCKLLLKTCVFIEGIESIDAAKRTRLTGHVEACQLVLGVVASPNFLADSRYAQTVHAIAKTFDGIIFDGRAMLDASGDIIAEVTSSDP